MVCWSHIEICHGTAFSGEASGDLGVVHSKTRNLSFLTLINVNNYITASISTQVLPGSGLETWDFLFLEGLPPPFTSQAETESLALTLIHLSSSFPYFRDRQTVFLSH